MKYLIPFVLHVSLCFVLIISTVSFSFAQGSYECLPHTGSINWFINNTNYLRGIRVDSVVTSFTDTIYYPYHTERYAYPIPDTNGGSWLGKKVIQKTDGTFLFDNTYGDTIIIKTEALLGDSWILYNDSGSRYYAATITALDTMTLLGALDSIKRIKLNAYNPILDTTDFLNNTVIILSKTHGFAKVCDLYDFPFHGSFSTSYIIDRYFTLLRLNNQFFNLVPFHIPTKKELYDYYAGDAFEYHTGTYCQCPGDINLGGLEYDSVLSRTDIDSAHTELLVYRHSKGHSEPCGYPDSVIHDYVAAWIDTIRLDNTPSFTMDKMPEEYIQPFEYFYYPFDTTECVKGGLIKSDVIFLFEGCDDRKVYKNGLGMIDTDFCTYSCMDAIGFSAQTTVTQVYARKNGVACGLFELLGVKDISKGGDSFSISPNPSNELATIITGNDRVSRKYIIANAMGATMKMFSSSQASVSFDVGGWPAGLYIVTVILENGVSMNAKMVVAH